MAADDVLALNDTSAAGATVRAPVSALPFLQVGQRGSANGVGSLDAGGRQPITEAADGAAEERAFAVTSASYTVARRVLIARDGCNEIALTAAAGAYKNIYVSNEKTSGSLTIRAVAGENINGVAMLTLSSGQSVGLVVVDGSPATSWKAEILRRCLSAAVPAYHSQQPRPRLECRGDKDGWQPRCPLPSGVLDDEAQRRIRVAAGLCKHGDAGDRRDRRIGDHVSARLGRVRRRGATSVLQRQARGRCRTGRHSDLRSGRYPHPAEYAVLDRRVWRVRPMPESSTTKAIRPRRALARGL